MSAAGLTGIPAMVAALKADPEFKRDILPRLYASEHVKDVDAFLSEFIRESLAKKFAPEITALYALADEVKDTIRLTGEALQLLKQQLNT